MAGRIPPDIIDRIRESTDIVELISGYVQLQRKGSNYFGLCPFHPEKTPSFSVHPGKGIFHCFGCGLGGNVFTFLQEHDKLSFAEAARELAQRAGIAIPADRDRPEKTERYDALYRAVEFACEYYSRCLWEGKGEEYERARQYLIERVIGQELAKAFRLGYAPDRWDGLVLGIKKLDKNHQDLRDYIEAGLLLRSEGRTYDRFRGRLMFPIFNLSGKPVGFGGRTLKEDTDEAKYVNTSQTPIYNKGGLLYGLHLAREQIRRRGECLIVEGYTDLMRLHEGGFTHAVATSGTALTTEQARILRRFCRKVVLVFDGDAAGSHAALRGGDVLLGADMDVQVVGLPVGHDPDSFISEEGPSAFGELLEKATDVISYRIDLYRREGRLTDALSRSEVARELLASLAVISDSIRRELTAQDAAQKIGIGKETLLRELGRARPTASASLNAKIGREDPFSAFPVKERGLLETLIRWSQLRAAVFSQITSKDFQHGITQRIASRMEDAWIGGQELKGEELIGDDTPIEEASFISYSLSQTEAEGEPGVDRKALRRYNDFRTAHDCLRDMLSAKLGCTYQQLKSDLAAAKNSDQQRALTTEIKKVLESQKEIKAKKFWDIPPHPSIDLSESPVEEG